LSAQRVPLIHPFMGHPIDPKGYLGSAERVPGQLSDQHKRPAIYKEPTTVISRHGVRSTAGRDADRLAGWLYFNVRTSPLLRASARVQGGTGGRKVPPWSAPRDERVAASARLRLWWPCRGARRPPDPAVALLTQRDAASTPERRQPGAAVPAPGHQRQDQERLERRKGMLTYLILSDVAGRAMARRSRYAPARRAAEPDGRLRL
jgi:hypothetical protein